MVETQLPEFWTRPLEPPKEHAEVWQRILDSLPEVLTDPAGDVGFGPRNEGRELVELLIHNRPFNGRGIWVEPATMRTQRFYTVIRKDGMYSLALFAHHPRIGVWLFRGLTPPAPYTAPPVDEPKTQVNCSHCKGTGKMEVRAGG